jgi:VWFA-related protein
MHAARLVPAAVAVALAAAAGHAQQTMPRQPPPTQPTLEVSVSTVLVDVVVRDGDGRPVPTLEPAEFVVEQDGRPQRVTLFEYVGARGTVSRGATGDAPGVESAQAAHRTGRTLVIVWDDLSLSQEAVYFAKQALLEFIDGMVSPQDSIAFVRTSGGARAARDLTGDRSVLREIVSRVHYRMVVRPAPEDVFGDRTPPSAAAPASPEGAIARSGISTALEAGPAPVPDASAGLRGSQAAQDDHPFETGLVGTLSATIESLRARPGRKGILVLSQGFTLRDRFLRTDVRAIARQAQDAGVAIYPINAERFDVPVVLAYPLLDSPYSWMAEGPSLLAATTGGIFFKNPSDLTLAATRAFEDQSDYYLLGYAPDRQTIDEERRLGPSWHALSVRVTRPGLRVRSRTGFHGLS